MNEIFKDIVGYEGIYQISNFGRVKSLEKIKIKDKWGHYPRKKEIYLKPSIHRKGYLFVGLFKETVRKCFKIHRLVSLHFIPNPENKPEVNHINGRKGDNIISNLEWATGSENIRHSLAIGTRKKPIGVLNGSAKLNDEKILSIRREYEQGGITLTKIADQYGVSYPVIRGIVAGKSWTHVK